MPMPTEDDGEDHEGQEQVHHRPAEHDDDALVHGESVEDTVLVPGTDLRQRCPAGIVHHGRESPDRSRLLDLLGTRRASLGVGLRRGQHADHPDEPAEGDGLEPVVRLPALA